MLSYRSSKIKTNYFQDYENSQSKYGISSDLSYDFVTEQVRFNDDWNDLVFGLDYSYGKNHLPLSTGQFTDDGDMIQVRDHTQRTIPILSRRIGSFSHVGHYPAVCAMTVLKQISIRQILRITALPAIN